MKLLAVLLLLGMAPMAVHADPFGTITCHDLKGSSIHYGVPFWEITRAAMEKKPVPKPHITEPKPDGYDSDITFVVGASKKQMTVVWGESATEAKLRVAAKKFNMAPPSPPPASFGCNDPDVR